MRKQTVLLLLATLSLAACGGSSTGLRPRMALFLPGAGMAADTAAAIRVQGQGRVELLVLDGRGLRSAQSDQLDSALKEKVQVALVACVDPADAGAYIEKAKSAKVPLVFFGPRPSAADLVKWDKAYYVGTRPSMRGRAMAEMAASLWASGPDSDRNRDGIMQYAVIRSQPTPESTEMAEGLIAGLASPGKAGQRLADETGGGREASRKLVASWAGRFGQSLEVLLCIGVDEALGAAEALASRRAPLILASGARGPALSAIASGEVDGSIVEDPAAEAKAALDLASSLAAAISPARLGWTISENKYLWVPPLGVTGDNLDSALGKSAKGDRR